MASKAELEAKVASLEKELEDLKAGAPVVQGLTQADVDAAVAGVRADFDSFKAASEAYEKKLHDELNSLKAAPKAPSLEGTFAVVDGKKFSVVGREASRDIVEQYRKRFIAEDAICLILGPQVG